MEHHTLLEQHGLSDSLLPVSSLANRVAVGQKYVVRIGGNQHQREVSIALHALECSIRTAKPLFWGAEYSIFERLHGTHPTAQTPKGVWLEFFTDLKTLHQNPFEPRVEPAQTWQGDLALLESHHLSSAELALAKRLLMPHNSHNLVFAHGDVWRNNILEQNGRYLALLDWGNAGWLPLERELAWLEDAALEVALSEFDVDFWQLAARRLEILLIAAAHGRGNLKTIQAWLEQVNG
jgi:aminoglycoside phosphotransferase (APT) family kinase protein